MLLVPTKVGDRVNGVIVLSSLGYGKFDERDQQVVEVLAPHAAAAFENAKLLSAEREAARTSTALLELSQRLVGRHSVGDILQEAIETIPSLMACAAVAAYVRDEESGNFHVARLHVVEPDLVRAPCRDRRHARRSGDVVPDRRRPSPSRSTRRSWRRCLPSSGSCASRERPSWRPCGGIPTGSAAS